MKVMLVGNHKVLILILDNLLEVSVLILILVNLPLVVGLGNNPPNKEVSSVEYLVVNLTVIRKVALDSLE